jgi:hypothetical protein
VLAPFIRLGRHLLFSCLCLLVAHQFSGCFSQNTPDIIASRHVPFGTQHVYGDQLIALGWFGYGWGAPFETHLTVMPDRTSVVVEKGSGANAHYQEGPSNAKRIEAGLFQLRLAYNLIAANSALGPKFWQTVPAKQNVNSRTTSRY